MRDGRCRFDLDLSKALVLALAVGVIVVGYRFAIFVVTLYTT